MKTPLLLSPIIFTLILAFSSTPVFGDLEPKSGYSLEGLGFAVTEETIQTSTLDLFFSTEQKTGTRMNLSVDDGFVSLNDDDFVSIDISGQFLRDGKFLRLQGTAQDLTGDEISIRFFGRLVESTNDASVYGFTGRLTHDGEENKIIYTAKIANFEEVVVEDITSTTTEEATDTVTVHILKGSADPSSFTYRDKLATGAYGLFNYYSTDRITIDPGTTITFVNDDDVSHSVTSGAGLGQNQRYVAGSSKQFACEQDTTRSRDDGFSYVNQNCTFAIDGRILSGEILPGESWSVEVNEMGFYRLADIDYPWMSIVIYAFPTSDSVRVGIPDPDDARNN